jgi:hypothetical protein
VETHECTKIFPEFMEIAKKEGSGQALWSFDVANQVEELLSLVLQHVLLLKDLDGCLDSYPH